MTLRMRLLLIGLVVLLTGVALIGTSYYQIARLHRGAEELDDHEIDRLEQQVAIRDTLHRIRQAQTRFNVSGSGAFEAEGARLRDQLRGLLDQAKAHWPNSGPSSQKAMETQLQRLGEVSEQLRDNRIEAQGEMDMLRDTLGGQIQLIVGQIKPLASRAQPPGERALMEQLMSNGKTLLQAHDLLRYAGADALIPWRETLMFLADTFETLRGALVAGISDESARQVAVSLVDQMSKVVEALRGSVARRTRIERTFDRLHGSWSDLFEALWGGSAVLTDDVSRSVRTRLTDIQNRRYNGLIWIIAVALTGFGIAALLGIAFVGGIERDLWALRDVARAIERGESPKDDTRLPGGVADLAELGRAFNQLAASLTSVRQTQEHRDQLVTGLNRSVHVSEILRLSLRSLTQATGAKAGCMYLKMAGREELLLAESFAVLRGATVIERVRYGEGLVGQAARDRMVMQFEDVPLQDLKIVTGTVEAMRGSLLVVPMIFKDELMGVVELAGLLPFDEVTRRFVEDSIFQIAVALNNARAVETIHTSAAALEQKTRELEEVNRELEQANLLKSEFLATMSHELRTPLNAIIGFTELVQLRDRGLQETSKANLDKVMRNAEQLLALITDILDLSRIEAGKISVSRSAVEMASFLDECMSHFTPMASSKEIGLKWITDPAVGVAMIDQDKLRRILQNLVSNAIKFTEEGEVRVKLWPEGDRLLFEVTDTGIGIDTELLPVIFEKFRQADGSRTRRYGGSGLGLAITKELCHSMGGSVRVSSKMGGGSVFRVSLPLIRPEQSELERPAEERM